MTDPSGPSAGGAACERCGDFAPLRRVGRRDLCAACIPRRHPILAEPPSAGLYVRWSFALLRTMGAPAAAVCTITAAIVTTLSVGVPAALGVVPGQLDPEAIAVSLSLMLLTAPVYSYVGAVTTALGVQAVDGYVDVRAALRTALARMPALLAVGFGGGVIVFAGLLCCCVPGFVFGLFLALPVPAIVAHGCGPIEAMRRSIRLVRGAFGPLTLALSVTSLVLVVGSLATQIPTLAYTFERMASGGPEQALSLSANPPAWFRALTIVESVIASLFLLPIANTATVVYLNRTEGAHAPGVDAG
jgi:hypothetical protein